MAMLSQVGSRILAPKIYTNYMRIEPRGGTMNRASENPLAFGYQLTGFVLRAAG
jgi:hypothetical protein